MTAQFHENLILNGEHTSMTYCPPLPEHDPRIVLSSESEMAMSGVVNCTACWRGYVGTWEIRAGRVYLVGLEGRFKLRDGEFLFADWLSGTLSISRGDMLQYVHMGFESVYEKQLLVTVEHGVVVKNVTVDHSAGHGSSQQGGQIGGI